MDAASLAGGSRPLMRRAIQRKDVEWICVAKQATIAKIIEPGKGILAADRHATITKRFEAVGIESSGSPVARIALLCATPGAGQYLSGVILFESARAERPTTARRFRSGSRSSSAGIKVDKGRHARRRAGRPREASTGSPNVWGLQGAGCALHEVARSVSITPANRHRSGSPPTPRCSRYAVSAGRSCRSSSPRCDRRRSSLDRCEQVTESVLHAVFDALHRHRVVTELIVLKPNMVVPGKKHARRASADEVAAATLRVLRRTVPASVPTINFLSGGQAPEEATANLNAQNVLDRHAPWVLSFSFARALQDPVMQLWKGKDDNVAAAQKAFHHRLKMNSLARDGKWTAAEEAR
jgi:fructose-bisphosphate aldolase class I